MSNPPPTEADLLRRYLLTPTLPEVVPFSKFTSLFPASVSRRHLRTLYLDLQRQRTAQLDKVAAAIDDEVRRSRDIRREMRAAARDREADEADEEIEIERALFERGAGPQSKQHTLSSIIPELESAAEDVEAEIKKLEQEEAVLLESLGQLVGGMSDLRYGRLSNPELRETVIESLKSVQETCKSKT